MYQALYRKWRPRGWGDVSGQGHVTETLRRQIESGRLSHAYLFVGTRGTGKTTCAKILSRAVNCERPVEGSPCNECVTCIGIENGSILDVLELDAASNNGVDNVRALREEAVYTPAAAKRRVYIIDEVHMLTPAAFNALLKILEEPPEHLLFILATTELHKVPATILSRCQRFSFKRLAPPVIAERLTKVADNEGFTLTREAADKLSRLADGSMRDALSLLDQCAGDTAVDLRRVQEAVGLTGSDELLKLANAVMERNAVPALETLDKLFMDGRDMSGLLGELSALFRDALVYLLSPGSALLSGGFGEEELSAITKKAPVERLFFCLETIKDAANGLTRGGNTRLAVETCLIRISSERLLGGEAAILSRLSRLETMSENGFIAAQPPQTQGGESVQITPAYTPDKPSQPDLPKEKIIKDESPATDEKPPEKETAESGNDGDFWGGIVELLRGDIAVYTLLRDKAQVSAELRDAVLTVRAGNPFTVNTIESKKVTEQIRTAAEKVLGRTVTIKVEQGNVKNEDKQSRLESLSAFGVIKFEE